MIPPQLPQLAEHICEVDGLAINYVEGPANGAPFVLLHGLGRNWQDFLALIPEFSQHSHLYLVDLRGHGKSARAPHGYMSAAYAADVFGLLSKVVRGPAILFGHSLGGVVGMHVAAEHPELISALILGDCVLSRSALQHSLYTGLFAGLYEVALQGGSVEEIARRLGQVKITVPNLHEPIALADFPGTDDGYFRRWADCLRQVDPEVFAMTLDGRSLADFDGRALLSRIGCPTLILQANPELGGLMSHADLEEAIRLLKRPTVARFPLLGHALHLQRPQPVSDAVLSFLKGSALL